MSFWTYLLGGSTTSSNTTTTTPPSNTWLYVGIAGLVIVFLLVADSIFLAPSRKSKKTTDV